MKPSSHGLPAHAAAGIAHSVHLPDLEAAVELTGAHLRTVNEGWRYPWHDHACFELNLVTAGEQRTALASGELHQRPGDLLLFAPFDAHSSRNAGSGALSYFCLHFDLDDPLLRQMLCRSGTRLFVAGSPIARALTPKLQRLIELAQATPPPGTDAEAQGLQQRLAGLSAWFDVLSTLTACLQDELASHPPVPAARLRLATQLSRWIEQQVQDPGCEQSLQALVARLGYSASHIHHLFREVFGMAPQQYRTRLKHRRARLLLQDATLTVRAVAEALGYDDMAHFSRQFKRWEGVSPLQFRQRAA
ncbi:AraC family transcriptional regulator [Eleftheria terrae]|uniref:AraC family transcriptional regulator n=1 Tax=Eleftheria terrae TaxID=1597781 RepID=UPI00263BDE47|nr:AraC family transcriptional regulator [Eleftheria terrae]WKB50923.1 AraC family transcriptional regulator [Eleftheria terrae]